MYSEDAMKAVKIWINIANKMQVLIGKSEYGITSTIFCHLSHCNKVKPGRTWNYSNCATKWNRSLYGTVMEISKKIFALHQNRVTANTKLSQQFLKIALSYINTLRQNKNWYHLRKLFSKGVILACHKMVHVSQLVCLRQTELTHTNI